MELLEVAKYLSMGLAELARMLSLVLLVAMLPSFFPSTMKEARAKDSKANPQTGTLSTYIQRYLKCQPPLGVF